MFDDLKVHIQSYTRWFYITGFDKIKNITGSDSLISIEGYFINNDDTKSYYTIEINQWLVLGIYESDESKASPFLSQTLSYDL
jgi:hypothetical protein